MVGRSANSKPTIFKVSPVSNTVKLGKLQTHEKITVISLNFDMDFSIIVMHLNDADGIETV